MERTAPSAVDFLVALGIFESSLADQTRRKKDRLDRQQTAAAAVLARWSIVDLAVLESVDLEYPLRHVDWPPTAWRAVADGLARHAAALRAAAALPLEWMYPSEGSKAASVFPLSGKRVGCLPARWPGAVVKRPRLMPAGGE